MTTIGGGSSMDTGKAIGIIINNPEFADVRSLEGVAPTKLAAIKEENLDFLAQPAYADACAPGNPRPLLRRTSRA